MPTRDKTVKVIKTFLNTHWVFLRDTICEYYREIDMVGNLQR